MAESAHAPEANSSAAGSAHSAKEMPPSPQEPPQTRLALPAAVLRWLCGTDSGHRLMAISLFVASRAAAYAAGLRMEIELRWMFLADVPELRDRLAETLLYFHAFPPGMNLLTGLLLKVSETQLAGLSHGVYWLSGLVLCLSLQALGRAAGLGRPGSTLLAVAFSLIPAAFYFENLYLYTHLTASLLCLTAVLFVRARRSHGRLAWVQFFLACAVLGWLRSTFHLIWFVAMFVTVLLLVGRGRRKDIVVAAVGPAVLLVSLYAKNAAVFGVFGATSWAGANLVAVTTRQLPKAERQQLIGEGKLSPFAAYSVFAEPKHYRHFFRGRAAPSWPGTQNLWLPTVRAPNYNHWYFLEVNKARRKDALYYLRTRFWRYLKTVQTLSLPQLFHPSTHWHPSDDDETSPHYRHRQALGKYEHVFDRVVHRPFLAPVGLYALLPLLALWALMQVYRNVRSSDPALVRSGELLLFGWLQIGYVVTASALMSFGESARYRFIVEAFIWLTAAMAAAKSVKYIAEQFGLRGPTRNTETTSFAAESPSESKT